MTTSLVKGMQRLSVNTASSSDAAGMSAAPKSGTLESGTFASRKVTAALPAAFQERFGFLGEKLAEALLCFSLDVVGLVAEYGKVSEEDLGLLEEVEKVGSFSKISPQVEERMKSLGKCIKHLNLLPQKFENTLYGNPFIVDFVALTRFILPNFPNLESLQIFCTGDAIVHLHKLPKLCHLEFGERTADAAKPLPDALQMSLSQLKLETLAFPTILLRTLSKLPSFQELREFYPIVPAGGPDAHKLEDFINTLKRFPNLRKLRLKPRCLQLGGRIENIHPATFKDLPLEVICFEQVLGRMFPDLEYPKTLKTLVFKDSIGTESQDCERIRRKNPNLQVIFLSSMNDEGLSKFKEIFSHRIGIVDKLCGTGAFQSL